MTLQARSGAIISTRDLALGLRGAGDEVFVYSPVLGPIADELPERGVSVVDRLSNVHVAPDLIHGHHHIETVQALLHFPGVPGLFVCRDPGSWRDTPPLHPRIRRFVGIDLKCEERLLGYDEIDPTKVRMVRHGFDLATLPPRPPLPPLPARALIYSNQAWDGGWCDAIRAAIGACAVVGKRGFLTGRTRGGSSD